MRLRLSIFSLMLLSAFSLNAGKLYFVNTPGWAQPYGYYWTGGDNNGWPGVAMMNTGIVTTANHTIWEGDYGTFVNSLFNHGNPNPDDGKSGNQTTLENQYFNYAKDKWFSPTGLYLVGSVTDEDLKDANKFSDWDGSSPTVVTFTKSLNANSTYTFRILYYDGATRYYRTNSGLGTMTYTNCSGWDMDGAGVDNGNARYTRITTAFRGEYVFKYDWAENILSIEYPSYSDCDHAFGSLGHYISAGNFSSEEVEYDILYNTTNDQLTFTLRSIIPGKELDYARVETMHGGWDLAGNGQQRSYTYTDGNNNRNWAGDDTYIVFRYRFVGNNTEYWTASGWNNTAEGRVNYIWGSACAETNDTQSPTNLSVSVKTDGITGTSVPLIVSATDNQPLPIRRYTITDADSNTWLVTDTDGSGIVTINGLTPCTDYTFTVRARDNAGNLSDPQVVTAKTHMYNVSVNLLEGLPRANFTAGRNSGNAWRIADRYGDNTSYDSGASTDVSTLWVQADLGNIYIVDTVKIQWETNNPSIYKLQFSSDGVNWRTYQYNERPAYGPNRDAYLFVNYPVKGEAARYVRVHGLQHYNPATTNFGMTIWEIQVFGDGTCPVEDTQGPTITSLSQTGATSSSVTLSAVTTDNTTSPVVHYEVDGLTYNAEAGEVTIDGFSDCEEKTIDVYARDKNGNRSAVQQLTARAGSFGPDVNIAYGKSCTAGYNAANAYRVTDKTPSLNDGWNGNGNATIANDWVQVDLDRIYNLNQVKIQWENNRTDVYQLQFSRDGSEWLDLQYDEAPTYSNRENNVYMTYPVAGLAARYVRVQAVHRSSGDGMYIWEIEVYGSGECYESDDQAPVMTSASSYSVTTSTAVLNVTATDDHEPVVIFEAAGDKYLAQDGKITITNLTPCTDYNFTIYAIDNSGNRSLNTQSVAIKTSSLPASENIALGKTVTVGHSEIANTHPYVTDGNIGTSWISWGTSDQWWAYIDLATMYYVDSVRIYWNDAGALPIRYGLYGSNDAVNWFLIQDYNLSPTVNVWTEYSLIETPTRYIKVQASTVSSVYGMRIAEMEVYATGECYEPISTPPTMISAEVVNITANAVTLEVEGRDYADNKVVRFVVDGRTYVSENDRIVIDGLYPCGIYTLDVACKDKAGNLSTNSIPVTFQMAPPAANTNLALNRPVYGGFYEGNLLPVYASDNSNRTRWGARYRPTANDEWLVIDLGGVYHINQIEVAWETGTAINYEFKSAIEASFSKCIKRGVNDDSSLQEEKECDCLVSGNFSTFEHKTDLPPSASVPGNNYTIDSDVRAADTYDYSSDPVLARYVMLKSGLNASYPASLWEFRVYGVPNECATATHKPIMQWAEVITVEKDAAEIYVSALDIETSEQYMNYEVEVTGGEDGQFQLTTIYHFSYTDFVNGNAGHLIIGGLLPQVPYVIHVYAIDGDGYKSDNYKTIVFTTADNTGCSFSSTEAYNVGGGGNHSTQIFQKGYTVTIASSETDFTITAYTYDDFWELTNPYIQVLNTPANPQGSGVTEYMMSPVAGEERTYEYTIPNSTYSGEITFFVKFPFVNGGICLTQPITYNVGEGCHPAFVIYHHDDKPTSVAETTYAGGTITDPIYYYRHFNAGVWEDLTMPFEVDSIRVYDPDDHRYYKLTAQYNDGSHHSGKFLLRKQVDNVSGEDFVPSWYDGNTPLPVQNQPYAIRFTSSYYTDKYVLFHGHKNQVIASSFTKGTAPTMVDQYMVYGNPTMMPQSVGTAYLLPADHSDETYRRATGAYVRPFETYVLASETTTSIMPIIAPWRGTPTITTSLDEVEATLVIQPLVEVYTITGQRVGGWQNTSIQEVADRCSESLPIGCYIIHTPDTTIKIIIK